MRLTGKVSKRSGTTRIKLAAEYAAVKSDPDIIEAVKDFRMLSSSEDLEHLLKALGEAVAADKSNDEMENGRLTQAVMSREIDDKTFVGNIILKIMHVLDQSPWVQKSVPKLANNENLMKFLNHLAKGSPEQDKLIRTELQLILGDREVGLTSRRDWYSSRPMKNPGSM